ncbi:hypothetical protein ASC97_32045 [Rhizobium sp. Root1203]|jgi:hypothetical protein|nr:hypothetical protein ASC97_32045 [Rhizobium sp. Root1203]
MSQGALTDRPNFRFEAHDLDIIHRAVSTWSLENGLGVGHEDTMVAARRAFFVYREGMNEGELLDMLHTLLSRRH